jgi:hypothetical protein
MSHSQQSRKLHIFLAVVPAQATMALHRISAWSQVQREDEPCHNILYKIWGSYIVWESDTTEFGATTSQKPPAGCSIIMEPAY